MFENFRLVTSYLALTFLRELLVTKLTPKIWQKEKLSYLESLVLLLQHAQRYCMILLSSNVENVKKKKRFQIYKTKLIVIKWSKQDASGKLKGAKRLRMRNAREQTTENSEGAKQSSSRAGLVWRGTKGLTTFMYISKKGVCMVNHSGLWVYQT